MKNLFYSIGIASFLVCMIFTVATSVTNPFYGMSDAAVAQATTQTTTSGSNGSTTGNYGGNVSYSINPNIYKVMSGRAKYTVSRKEGGSIDGGSLGFGYKGFGIDGGLSIDSSEDIETMEVDLGPSTVCIKGGRSECYKAPNRKTVFF